MAKRISLSDRRASDARGVDVLFGGAPAPVETIGLETDAVETQATETETIGAEEKSSGRSLLPQMLPISAVPPVVEPADSPVKEAKPTLAKVTIYIRPEQVFAIESIQLAQRQSTGQKPDKSELLQEAVDLLIAKYQG